MTITIQDILSMLNSGEILLSIVGNFEQDVIDQTAVKTFLIATLEEHERVMKDAQWRPIGTAPVLVYVLACNALGYVGRAIQMPDGKWKHIGKPTRWKPLPIAPTIDAQITKG